ncbi:SMEK domain-containing protein [Flavobacterium sp. CSZ]|uniref:SMEK domain-containing protein n=1 Tax=Flavobacterium sp. CSZ TaxID=2783791 RepID=UPI00188C2249|nr:SMEK domain-containing protein [Flavobacterium sp. CSZ]MBF4485765.1 SMEK domain-containing protein [Flavobacterium sp. CSZ]
MSTGAYYENVQRNLLLFVTELESSNAAGLTNSSLHAENLFLRIFNIVFDWELVNANELTMNQSGYDLIDSSRKIYIQITANKQYKSKINYSLEGMKNVQTPEGSELIVFFMKNKITPIYKVKTIHNGLSYRAEDVQWLLKNILNRCDIFDIQQIDELLTLEMRPLVIKRYALSKAISVHVDKQQLINPKKGLYLHREALIDKMFLFSQENDGLLAGGAGFGKSTVIDALQRYYDQLDIPCYVVRINELIKGGDKEVGENIGVGEKWYEKLLSVQPRNEYKGLILFDGLDTAKDPLLRKSIFKAIRTAQSKLKGSWNVMAGCRTYDAVKSEELQLLFPKSRADSGLIGCRNIEIPPYSSNEVENIFLSHPKMGSLVRNCTNDLLSLLTVPYFMGLLEEIAYHNTDERLSLSGITSESQLLEFYWRKKIGNKRRLEVFTHSLTDALIRIPALSIETYSIVSLENEGEAEELLAQGIITENGIHRRSISFAHNILLEYAVSRFMFFEQIDLQVDFIATHKRLPFLFRQSFIYFYNHLWDFNRQVFWEHYFHIKTIDEPLFRLFHQTILEYVVIENFSVVEDLLPLREELDEQKYAEAVRRVMESIWFIHKGNVRLKDVDFLCSLSGCLHPVFLWPLGLQIEAAIDKYSKEENQDVLIRLSETTVSFMRYVLKERLSGNHKDYIDRNAGYRGIKNLCNLIRFQPEAGQSILKEIMTLLDEEDFPISYFQTIGECITVIFAFDSLLGADIYKSIYFHQENSDKVTNMGTAVLTLNSNRRQDFGHTYYILEQKYKELLQTDFASAVHLGARIVNKINSQESYRPNDNLFPVRLGEIRGAVLRDYSSYEKDEQHGPYLHGRVIFEVLQELVRDGIDHKQIQELLLITAQYIQAGVLWRKYLSFLKENAYLFSNIVFEILKNDIFFKNDETLFEITELLESAWKLMSEAQRMLMETMIFQLADPKKEFHDEEWQAIRLRRILSVIPISELQMASSIEFLKENELYENRPLIKKGLQLAQSKSRTDEDLMMGYGFSKEERKGKVYSDYKKLIAFNDFFSKKENQTPVRDSYDKEYQSASNLFKLAEARIFNNDLKQNSCDDAIANFGNILSAWPKKINLETQFFLKRIALHYMYIEQYKEKNHQSGDLSSRNGGFYSPNARITSVRTLMNLMYDSHDRELETVVLELISDNMAVVRLKALSSLSYFWNTDKENFWKKTFERVAGETDGLCLNEIISRLCYDNLIKECLENIQKISSLISRRLYNSENGVSQDLWRSYVVLLLIRILRHDRENAINEIKAILGNREFSRALIFEINGTIDSFNKGNNFIVNLKEYSVLFEVLKQVLEFRFKALKSALSDGSDSNEHFEIVDNVIQNIHFILDFENNNDSRILTKQERKALVAKVLPILEYAVEESEQIQNGFMAAHTGFYFMKSLNFIVEIEPAQALSLSARVVSCAAANGFTYDQSTLKEVVVLTEKMINSHKELLFKTNNFDQLIIILDQFAQSGSQEALQLTWNLKEAF